MKTIAYAISPEQREALSQRLRVLLENEPDVRFAYLYGSVLKSNRIHDVDIGLFLDDTAMPRQAAIADRLSATLAAAVEPPVDVQVLNHAPLSFQYHALQGQLLVCRDETLLTDMLEDVPRRYLDLAPLLRTSTKDAFAA